MTSRSSRLILATLIFAVTVGRVASGEIIDRIMAVVLQQPLLLSDVNAALSLQLVQVAPGSADPRVVVLDRLIERTLMLGEVERYQPPEPAPAEMDARVRESRRVSDRLTP